MNEKGLQEIRNDLDKIDNEILDLINQRIELVQKVGILKHNSGGAIYRPEREKEIIERLQKLNKGNISNKAIEALYLEIFAISRNFELPENVAFLGPKGSFTHQAAEERFGALSSYLPVNSIKGVFREVNNKKAKFGVIPIENSSNGIVNDTINCLAKYNLKIIAEVILDIHHTLASKCDNIKDIKKIYSKDIAFDQCKIFLEDIGLDEIEHIPIESTTKAAKIALEEENSAAICSRVGAKMYNLPILFDNIEDTNTNRTRFFIISDFENLPSNNDKTTILANFPNEKGALVKFLQDFDKSGINLTKIKSHIVQGNSLFFIDFDGHKIDKNIKNILEKNKNIIKFLGSYIKEADDIFNN